MIKRRRDKLATHNERVKLFAGLFNTIGLGFIAFAVLRPLVDGTMGLQPFSAIWGVTGLAMHGAAHYILRYLEKETRDDDL